MTVYLIKSKTEEQWISNRFTLYYPPETETAWSRIGKAEYALEEYLEDGEDYMIEEWKLTKQKPT